MKFLINECKQHARSIWLRTMKYEPPQILFIRYIY